MGPPDSQSPKSPQQQKNKFQKTLVNVISLKSKRYLPKSNVISPKVNVKYV